MFEGRTISHFISCLLQTTEKSNTTEKSKGVFSAEQAKVLDLLKDMIKGAHISKPVITTRLQGGSMTKALLKTAL